MHTHDLSHTVTLPVQHIVRVAVDMADGYIAAGIPVDMLVDLLSLDGDTGTRNRIAAMLRQVSDVDASLTLPEMTEEIMAMMADRDGRDDGDTWDSHVARNCQGL